MMPDRSSTLQDALVGLAYNRQTITYEDMSDLMDYGNARTVSIALDPVLRYCQENGLRPLTALVVSKYSGVPGGGFTRQYPDVPRVQQKVYACDWHAIYPPTANEFARLIGH